ncbi:MAG: hypothetical protein HKN76_14580, partial [Saprospiraceae bacterium]|nr:hypothetical protein [Saprospiraceae bacterium]
MARRLTTFSKFLITMLIILGLFFGIRFVLNETDLGSKLKEQSQEMGTDKSGADAGSANASTPATEEASDDEEVLTVQLVTWGGYAPGLYFNEGARSNSRSRFLKEYGLKVDFILNDNLETALNAWVADEYDVLVQTADAFPLYTAPTDINAYEPKA